MTADEFAKIVGTEAANELNSAQNRIMHCLNQLNDEQIWWRPVPAMNSIGNVLLHLCGNLRQWVIVGLGGGIDTRNRPAEFSHRQPITKAELVKKLDATVRECKEVLQQQTASGWLKVRRIQAEEVTGLKALFNSIPHFRGHTQEIIYITRLQLGDGYKFAWTPKTVEEGAVV